MADVQIDAVDKVYDGGVHAVRDLSLEISDGEFLVLVGPSGCGKTTALRMVAGLETITDGTISIGGRVVNELTPKDRDVAMVFQNYALYPHLSVADNIAFGLRLRKRPKKEVEDRIMWAAKLLDLTPYLARKPRELSGGQRQRVAMGRAIVRNPQVFLMDEPLSNLDAKLRVQMRAEIAKLQRELGTTTIYVTHDQIEAMTMGDRVAVMSMGVLLQVDRPQALYDEPANLFVASFIGTPPMNLFAGRLRVEGEDVYAEIGTGVASGRRRLPAPLRRDQGDGGEGRRRRDARGGPVPGRDSTRPADSRRDRRAGRGARLRPAGVLPHRRGSCSPSWHARRRPGGGGGGRQASPSRTSLPPSRRGSSYDSARASPSRWTRAASTSSTRRRVRRSVSCAIAAVAAIALGAGGAGAASDQARPPTGSELERLAQPPTYSPFASERIYFVLPDRYANGDPSNDLGGPTGPRSVTGYDPTDPGWYHGGDLAGLTGGCTDTKHGLARLVQLGFTAIWIAPVVGQQPVQGDSAAYHGYWGLDFTRVDPHFGTNEDFAAFANCAHRLGLKVYLDVVVNHTADVILPAGGSTFRGADEVPYRDCRGKPYSAQRLAGTKRFPCVSRAVPAATAARPPAEPRAEAPGLAQPGDALPQPREHRLLELLAGVPRAGRLLRARRPLHRAAVRRLGARRDLRGLGAPVQARRLPRRHGEARRPRLLPLVGPEVRAAARAAGVQDFEIFGEVFVTDAAELASFVRDRACRTSSTSRSRTPSCATPVVRRGRGESRRACGGRLLPQARRRGSDSGDVPRQPRRRPGGAADQAAVRRGGKRARAPVLLGYSLLYFLRGAPVVYYGDEVGIIGRGGDKAARQDMFPTKVEEWQTEERVGGPPIGTGSSFDVDTTEYDVAAGCRPCRRSRAVPRVGDGVDRRALRAGRRPRPEPVRP